MEKQLSPKFDQRLLEAVQETPAERIWCEACGTDEFVLVERARWRRRHGKGFWDVDYFCTQCDRFYGHVVRDEDVTPAVLAAMAAVAAGAANGRAKAPQGMVARVDDAYPVEGTLQ